MKHQINGNDLFLYAMTTGALYPTHCALARRGALLGDWRLHVIDTVLPLYRKELRKPSETIAPSDLRDAAGTLREYYLNHVAECDAAKG